MVARGDLRADCARSGLAQQGAFLEPGQEALNLMRAWLGLDRVEISSRGELAAAMGA